MSLGAVVGWVRLVFRNAFLTIKQRPKSAAASLQKLLKGGDPISRRFGAAMVVRPRLFIDPAFVDLAAAIEDAEVVTLLGNAIERPLPPWADWDGPPKAG